MTEMGVPMLIDPFPSGVRSLWGFMASRKGKCCDAMHLEHIGHPKYRCFNCKRFVVLKKKTVIEVKVLPDDHKVHPEAM